MIIFSTVFKILNKLKGNLILYTVILLAITLFNTTSGNMNHYEATKPDILIVNKDQNNEITKGFVSYLKEQATLKDIDINDQEKVDDALFYRDISYVVYIPENFGDDLVNDKNPTIEYKSNGNENASFTQMLIEKYIKTVNLYKEHYQGKALNQKVKQVINQKTKVNLHTSLDSSKLNQVNVYFNFLNYALLAGGVYCMTMILASLNQEGVRKRTIMSSFSYRKYNWIVFASLGLASFIVWLAYMIISFILFKEIMLSGNGIAYILNSFVFSICSLAVGFLIGTITHNKQAIGGIVNVVALGTSFLCGCFVPMSFMPSYVLKIAHILPTYYFVQNNELIKTLPSITDKLTGFINNTFDKFDGSSFDIEGIKNNILDAISTYGNSISSNLPTTIVSAMSNLVSGLGTIFFGLIIGLYMLFDFDNVTNLLLKVFPKKHQMEVASLVEKIGSEVRKCVNGTLLVACMVFVCDTIGFSIIGLKSALLFGLFCGITDLIPYIGPYLGTIVATVVGLTQSPLIGLGVFIIACIVQLIESYVLQPIVMSKATNLHPIVIICGLLIFGHFFGIVGMILASPIMSILKVIWEFIVTKFSLFQDNDGESIQNLSENS